MNDSVMYASAVKIKDQLCSWDDKEVWVSDTVDRLFSYAVTWHLKAMAYLKIASLLLVSNHIWRQNCLELFRKATLEGKKHAIIEIIIE